MKKKFFVSILIVLFACSMIFAQGAAESSKDFRYANYSTETESHYELTTSAIDNYNATNPAVKAVNDRLPHDAYLVQVNALAAANDVQEVLHVNGTMSKSFGQTGALLRLNDFVAEYDYFGIDPNYYKEHSVKGDIYAIPWSVGTYGFIVYNAELLASVGYDEFPKDLVEFKDCSDKLIAKGIIPMAFGDKGLWPADSLTFSAFVNKFVGNEWTDNMVAKNGKASFNDPEFIQALAAFQQLAKDGTFNDNFTSLDNDERKALYMRGEAAMISAGDWEVQMIVEDTPEIAAVTEIAAWPGPATGAKADDSFEVSCAWGVGIGSNVTDSQLDAIGTLLSEHLMTSEQGQKWAEEHSEFAAWPYEFDASKLNPLTAKLLDARRNVTACLNWDAVLDSSVKTIYQRGLQELLVGSISPEELGASMQAEYESLF